MGGWEFGERGGRDKRQGQKKGGRIQIKTSECSPLGLQNLSFTGWHSLTIPVPWQSWSQPLWIVEQLQDHPCAEQNEAQHTPRLPLTQTVALCISSSLANTKDLSLLKYNCFFWELFCAAPSCAAGWAIVLQNSREAHARNYKMQVLLVGALLKTQRVLSLPSLLLFYRQNLAPKRKKRSHFDKNKKMHKCS